MTLFFKTENGITAIPIHNVYSIKSFGNWIIIKFFNGDYVNRDFVTTRKAEEVMINLKCPEGAEQTMIEFFQALKAGESVFVFDNCIDVF